jgi:hypothetical protein
VAKAETALTTEWLVSTCDVRREKCSCFVVIANRVKISEVGWLSWWNFSRIIEDHLTHNGTRSVLVDQTGSKLSCITSPIAHHPSLWPRYQSYEYHCHFVFNSFLHL